MTVEFRRILFYGMVALPFLALALQIWSVASNWSWYQYDFRAYYTGPALYAAGEDPYSLEAHLALARDLGLGQQKLPFVYSPVMLQLLSPLAWFPYPVIYGIWLSAQVLALGAVIFLTMRALTVPLPHIAWMAAFGLNGTVAAVLRSGQMSLMVLAVLMLGVWALGAGRWRAATVLMTLAAVPKIWVLPLLSLIAVPLRLVRLLWMVGGVIVCLAIGMSGRWVFPELQLRYETIIADFLDFSGGPAGPYNGTITNILATLEELGYLPQETGPTIWLGIAALVLAVSAFVCLRLPGNQTARIFAIATLGLCLIAPRMVIYQWTIAIPAMAFVLSRLRGWPLAVMAVLALTPTLYVNRYLLQMSVDLPVDNLPFLLWSFSNYFVVLAGWIICLTLRPSAEPSEAQKT